MLHICSFFLDFDFLHEWQKRDSSPVEDPEQCKTFVFEENNFQDSVIVPQHRKMETFLVEEIVYDRNPKSTFPNDSQTYAEYYRTHYGKHVTDEKQPLLR